MKKLKIFLLLSILLCFGFALSSEVHAQGDGPKIFEVNDVLPATSQLRISWEITDIGSDIWTTVYTNNNTFELCEVSLDPTGFIEINGVRVYSGSSWISPYTDQNGNHNYMIIDISSWSETERTVSNVYYGGGSGNCYFYWEDLIALGPKIFEEEDVLPAGYIKISWDFTGKPIPDKAVTFTVKSGDDVFNDLIIQIDFNSGSYNHLKIFNGGSVEHFNVDTPGFTIITLTESVTITDLEGTDGITSLDYNVYIGDALLWEVVSEDYLNGFMEAREIYGFRYMGGPWMSGEAAWNHGYDKGSEETWDEGFEYGMETFGYYDPITEQWLSVEEYLDLYGTDKIGQSDFYNNFDKYFIPAMIIVFGGAIVLTILKVFKGRE